MKRALRQAEAQPRVRQAEARPWVPSSAEAPLRRAPAPPPRLAPREELQAPERVAEERPPEAEREQER